MHDPSGDDEEQDEETGHLLAEPAPVLATTAAEASAIIGRVLDGAHEDLARLLNEDNLQLRFLEVARQYLAGRDESAELQACVTPLLLCTWYLHVTKVTTCNPGPPTLMQTLLCRVCS